MSACKAVPVAADDTAGSFTVTFPSMVTITGFLVQILDSGNNVITDDADITVSGNVMTIADGSTYAVTADEVHHILVWGTARL